MRLAGELFELLVKIALGVRDKFRRVYLAGLAIGLREEVLYADGGGDELREPRLAGGPS